MSAAVLDPLATSVRGKCRICGCTENAACVLERGVAVTSFIPMDAQNDIAVFFDENLPLTCSWTDESETLCTNPRCLQIATLERAQ